MKICFILPIINLAGGIISTIELANHLYTKGHEVTVVHPSIIISPRLKWFNFRSIWCSFNVGKKAEDLLYNRIKPKCRMIKVPTLKEKYIPEGDVIIATWWETAYYVNNYPADKGTKFYFVRGYEIWSGNKELVDKTYSLPLRIITTSSSLKNLLKNDHCVDLIGTVPNGVNFDIFYKTQAKLSSPGAKRIGMVYSRTKLKGMQNGFEAFQIARKTIPDIKLVLFGSPMGNDVPNDVEFHEYPKADKLRDLYNSLDIFMLPSHPEEGFANPPMEAMACGVPCVLTKVGGVPDYTIPGKTALVVNPNDSRALAESLILLLSDEKLRRTVAQEGCEHIRNFSWEKSAAILETILKEQIADT
jgi:glycosyltransferase involved in cell wall biosynthesis